MLLTTTTKKDMGLLGITPLGIKDMLFWGTEVEKKIQLN